jgi:hypothetical protein
MSEALSFAQSVYDAVDSMDETNLAKFLTDECTFTFGNAKPVMGRAAAAEASKAFLSLIAGIKHEINDVWSVDDTIITRITVTYTRKDKKTMSFPAVTIWRAEGRQISITRYISIILSYSYPRTTANPVEFSCTCSCG